MPIAEALLSVVLAAAAPCGPSGAETYAQTDRTRVYDGGFTDVHPSAWACMRGRRPVPLDPVDDEFETQQVLERPVALNRRYAAYAVERDIYEGASPESYVDVHVLDIERRRKRVSCGCRAFRRDDIGYTGEVTDIVVGERGAVAWIGSRHLIAWDERGHRELDTGARRGTLELRGGRLTWRHRGGSRRTATLRGRLR